MFTGIEEKWQNSGNWLHLSYFFLNLYRKIRSSKKKKNQSEKNVPKRYRQITQNPLKMEPACLPEFPGFSQSPPLERPRMPHDRPPTPAKDAQGASETQQKATQATQNAPKHPKRPPERKKWRPKGTKTQKGKSKQQPSRKHLNRHNSETTLCRKWPRPCGMRGALE